MYHEPTQPFVLALVSKAEDIRVILSFLLAHTITYNNVKRPWLHLCHLSPTQYLFSSLLSVGVRQRTVRQESTMDKSGTMPIFVYDNCRVLEYHVKQSTAPQISIEVDENSDDLKGGARGLIIISICY